VPRIVVAGVQDVELLDRLADLDSLHLFRQKRLGHSDKRNQPLADLELDARQRLLPLGQTCEVVPLIAEALGELLVRMRLKVQIGDLALLRLSRWQSEEAKHAAEKTESHE